MINNVYGRLTVLRKDQEANRNTKWICRCQCGTEKSIRESHLKSGATQSCGCLNRERCKTRFTTHGMTKSKEYAAWNDMKQRCSNSNHRDYKYYGARGISVSHELEDFDYFFRILGPRPDGYELDRIDNNEGYTPTNIRWAKHSTQNHNRRKFGNVSKYRGVSFDPRCSRWYANITFNKKTYYLGIFNSEVEAAIAYDSASTKFYGIDAQRNFS
jgi:hypothetical protein